MGQECFTDTSLSGLENHSFLHVDLTSEIMMKSVALVSAANANHSGVSQY